MKNPIFRKGGGGVVTKKQTKWEFRKKGVLGQFPDLRGGRLGKKEGGVFMRGVDNPMHTV